MSYLLKVVNEASIYASVFSDINVNWTIYKCFIELLLGIFSF